MIFAACLVLVILVGFILGAIFLPKPPVPKGVDPDKWCGIHGVTRDECDRRGLGDRW